MKHTAESFPREKVFYKGRQRETCRPDAIIERLARQKEIAVAGTYRGKKRTD